MTREQAKEMIDDIIDQINVKWKEAQQISDEAGVSFSYSSPDDHNSGVYYPKRPGDWIVWNDYDREYPEGYDDDPNKSHPEHEEYHPWNNFGEYEYDWSKGHWISSSERC